MITKVQYKKLKSILSNNGTTATDFEEYREIYQYLFSCRYIKSSIVRGYNGYVITELGKVELRNYKNDSFRFWFPTMVSIIALLLSALSILIGII